MRLPGLIISIIIIIALSIERREWIHSLVIHINAVQQAAAVPAVSPTYPYSSTIIPLCSLKKTRPHCHDCRCTVCEWVAFMCYACGYLFVCDAYWVSAVYLWTGTSLKIDGLNLDSVNPFLLWLNAFSNVLLLIERKINKFGLIGE